MIVINVTKRGRVYLHNSSHIGLSCRQQHTCPPSPLRSYAMNQKVLKHGIHSLSTGIRQFSVSSPSNVKHSCKLLIIGGGSGGCAMAAKFVRRLGPKRVMILEPSQVHYYQPFWTLVGAGVKSLASSVKPMVSVLPDKAVWLRDSAGSINPDQNTVVTTCGDVICYEYLIVASGIEIDYDRIPGLREALWDPESGVTTIYNAESATRTWENIQRFKGGDAIFTYPDTPIKCPGAPQKIAYLADASFRKRQVRSVTNMSYMTSLSVIFGVPKYAQELLKVAERKKIKLCYLSTLKEIFPARKEAVFYVTLGEGHGQVCQLAFRYDLLHVGPPMKTHDFIRCNATLSDEAGYLSVNKSTLQHSKYENIYGIGDCTNTPNSKTASAIGKQCLVVEKNLLNTMKNQKPSYTYDGYGACPLLTEYGKCILAEFKYGGVVHETFPYNQAKESTISWYMKTQVFPFVYWNLMVKGRYHGSELFKKIFAPFKKNS